MTVFTPNQVAVLLYGVNWAPSASDVKSLTKFLDTAIAVCTAESGRNPKATNGNAKGLWQIMTTVHADRIGDQDIYNPHVNTLIARDLWHERGWKPWEAYTNGAYKKYLGYGPAAFKYLQSKSNSELNHEYIDLSGVDTGQVIDVDKQAIDSLGAKLDAVFGGSMLGFLKSAGASAGVFLLGVILLVLGVVYIASQSKAGKAVINNTPAGIVKKVAGK